MDINPTLKLKTDKQNRRLRLVIYRPHSSIWFRGTVGMILKRISLPNKYGAFLDFLLRMDVDVFFTSSLTHDSHLKGRVQRVLDGLHLVSWCVLNRISLREVSLIFSKKSLADKDALFLMHYGNFTFETENFAEKGWALAQRLAELRIHKTVHLTHYAYCPASGARNLTALRPDLIVAENNLAVNSTYYQKYFADVPGQFLCLPYTPALRFQKHRKFDKRIKKLVVTGSITYNMKSPEFIEFFQVNELQPMRRKLYEQAQDYQEQMDCLVSDLNASRQKKSEHAQNRILAFAHRIFSRHSQQDYYKRDIVDIYNSYAMFSVPEEICDLPAIGFVEGMACGSAYIGLDMPMYRDLGMIPGVHYISYDGTVDDLMGKVRYYQHSPAELSVVAQAGYEFVIKNLSINAIYTQFLARLSESVIKKNAHSATL
jgi:hypothetical protein